jgi:protoheme IX farnesyltransferase
VVLTTMFGYSVAPGAFVVSHFVTSAAGTACFAVAASCINQILERDLDAKMVRTRSRPLPMKTLRVSEAVGLGVGATVLGTVLLSWHPVCLALGLSNVLLYGFVYTPLKQRTTLNTPIGAIVGAIPPVRYYF